MYSYFFFATQYSTNKWEHGELHIFAQRAIVTPDGGILTGSNSGRGKQED